MTTAEREMNLLKCFLLKSMYSSTFQEMPFCSKNRPFCKSSFCFLELPFCFSDLFSFFYSYLAKLRPTLNHHRGNSLTNQRLITAFYYEGHGESPGVPLCFPEVPFYFSKMPYCFPESTFSMPTVTSIFDNFKTST